MRLLSVATLFVRFGEFRLIGERGILWSKIKKLNKWLLQNLRFDFSNIQLVKLLCQYNCGKSELEKQAIYNRKTTKMNLNYLGNSGKNDTNI